MLPGTTQRNVIAAGVARAGQPHHEPLPQTWSREIRRTFPRRCVNQTSVVSDHDFAANSNCVRGYPVNGVHDNAGTADPPLWDPSGQEMPDEDLAKACRASRVGVDGVATPRMRSNANSGPLNALTARPMSPSGQSGIHIALLMNCCEIASATSANCFRRAIDQLVVERDVSQSCQTSAAISRYRAGLPAMRSSNHRTNSSWTMRRTSASECANGRRSRIVRASGLYSSVLMPRLMPIGSARKSKASIDLRRSRSFTRNNVDVAAEIDDVAAR